VTNLAPGATDASAVLAAARDGDFVLLGVPDVHGSIRGKALRPDAFAAALRDGTVMTNLLLALDPTDAPITDYDQLGVRTGAPDLLVRPEAETFHELSWRLGWRICLGTLAWPDGSRCELVSREVLRTALEGLRELGYEARAAFEYEIRLRRSDGLPLSSGISYSLTEILAFDEFLARLTPALAGLGVELSAVHTEAGPGLLELNVAARPGLRSADDAVLLKLAVKEVAASLGLTASFLAKTVPGEEGSSGHVHLSFWQEGENAFAPSEAAPSDPPTVVAAAIAGILDHLPAASLLLNPTLNSYKRLVPGFFAPVNASWGLENRSAAVRLIRSADADRCRIECRRPGADANPYLALAALVVAACDGIRRGATPPPQVEGDASAHPGLPALPLSLEEALHAFEADAEFRSALGDEFAAYFAISRRWELKAWQQTVTEWERERYARAV
jgi:glutamine synthetase